MELANNILYKLKGSLGNRCWLCLSPSVQCICSGCLNNLPTNQICCPVCALELPESHSPCGDCLKQPKPFRQTVSAYLYEAPVDTIINRFKDGQPFPLGPFLANQLAQSIELRYPNGVLPDMIIPVPSHWSKVLLRGYNPAHYLANLLGHALNLPVSTIVRRKRTIHSQKTLGRTARLRNLKKAFVCSGNVQGKTVAIVDDVITTCATAIAMSQLLLELGALAVDVWAPVRTP